MAARHGAWRHHRNTRREWTSERKNRTDRLSTNIPAEEMSRTARMADAHGLIGPSLTCRSPSSYISEKGRDLQCPDQSHAHSPPSLSLSLFRACSALLQLENPSPSCRMAKSFVSSSSLLIALCFCLSDSDSLCKLFLSFSLSLSSLPSLKLFVSRTHNQPRQTMHGTFTSPLLSKARRRHSGHLLQATCKVWITAAFLCRPKRKSLLEYLEPSLPG